MDEANCEPSTVFDLTNAEPVDGFTIENANSFIPSSSSSSSSSRELCCCAFIRTTVEYTSGYFLFNLILSNLKAHEHIGMRVFALVLLDSFEYSVEIAFHCRQHLCMAREISRGIEITFGRQSVHAVQSIIGFVQFFQSRMTCPYMGSEQRSHLQ